MDLKQHCFGRTKNTTPSSNTNNTHAYKTNKHILNEILNPEILLLLLSFVPGILSLL